MGSKRNYTIALFLVLTISTKLVAGQGGHAKTRDYLSSNYAKYGSSLFNDLSLWRSRQRASVIEKVAALPDTVKAKILKVADVANNYQWPSLTAALYLDYKQTGTRVNYEKLQNERRAKLSELVSGEIIDRKGKYIPQIANGLWLILEESTWVEPAHIMQQQRESELPDPSKPYIDLGASATAATVAETYWLLEKDLDSYSKMINKRIRTELQRRIFAPYLKDNYWWMGFNGGMVNNWNIYNNTNCLQTALLVMQPGDSLKLFTQKLLKSADKFINNYPADGGCDEGPSYWNMAGGKLIRLLTLLESASNGKMSWKDNSLIHSMGTYIYKMQIAGDNMVNFADASGKSVPNPESVFGYGQTFNDELLKEYSAYLFKETNDRLPNSNVTDFIADATIFDQLTTLKPNAPYPSLSYFSNLEVVCARSFAGSTKGLFFAAKGGNNAESHNHNDLGNFIVYADGRPVLIDIGVGTYTSKTFSSRRYELWNVQSQWHNCPTVNGFQQKDGKQYHVTGFESTANKNLEVVSMDISKAYPDEAGILSWNRSFRFYPAQKRLLLNEQYQLKQFKTPAVLNFITCEKVYREKGLLKFGSTGTVLRYDPARFDISIEEKRVDDDRIRNVWGKSVYKIMLTSKSTELKGKYTLQISQS